MSKLTARLGFGRYEADEYYHIALDFFRKNRLTDAIQNINYALMLIPDHAEYRATRGFFYLEDGVLEQAEADFDAALAMNEFEVLANYCKGVLSFQRKEWEAARDYFMKAWAADTGRPEPQYYLALVAQRLGDYGAAARWMGQARQLLEAQGDKARARDAEKWLEEFERLKPKD